jgi:light-regulated signal transduction histidine kinase (bacteriophytochrome)
VITSSATIPAFGAATLSNCEREQIHLAGSIQPHGALLVCREPDLLVVQASANAATFLGLPASPVGRSLAALGGTLLDILAPLLADPLAEIPAASRACIGSGSGAWFDVVIHRTAAAGLIVELERASPPLDLADPIEQALRRVLNASSLTTLCDDAAAIFRALTGFDRVMIYRFDEEGHGQVLSEARRPELEAFLGNRYPSTDIPHIARRLYERNRVRVLADVTFTPVALEPVLSPLSGAELDMSLCTLRASSPIHVQYLKNMGVAATLVISLMVDGRLWGLVSCHHYSPRTVQFEMRAVCELLAETVATRIAALESFVQSQVEASVRRLEQRIIESISREGDWRVALFDGSTALLSPLGATGAALLFEGQCHVVGEVPGSEQIRAIGAWLDSFGLTAVPRASVFATSALGVDAPDFAAVAGIASGLVATPVASPMPGVPGEYIMWFRTEQIRTVTWGGDPSKAMLGDDPLNLSPRRSFAQWHQVVEGTSQAWSSADLAAARLIGESLADVVLQFRSVRMLIAQDQLDQVTRQVGQSDQAVVIAGDTGRVLQMNAAFARLLPDGHEPILTLEDLPMLFRHPIEIQRRLSDLRRHHRIWRGEVELATAEGGVPMLVRADPVFSQPDRALGFVLLFTDMSARKAADTARRNLQDGIVSGQRAVAGKLDTRNDLVFQNLLAAVVENAQMAALEITEGVETASMPVKLDSVRASVRRAADLLERLIRHAGTALPADQKR